MVGVISSQRDLIEDAMVDRWNPSNIIRERIRFRVLLKICQKPWGCALEILLKFILFSKLIIHMDT
jgi:DNA-binding Xre family transcriptional regulator